MALQFNGSMFNAAVGRHHQHKVCHKWFEPFDVLMYSMATHKKLEAIAKEKELVSWRSN